MIFVIGMLNFANVLYFKLYFVYLLAQADYVNKGSEGGPLWHGPPDPH